MAIYHLHAKMISRGANQDIIASAAYRSGEKIKSERYGTVHDYTHKGGVIKSEIIAPENVPDWIFDRSKLWNEIDRVEKRKDAQLAREIEVSIPQELGRESQELLVKTFVNDSFVKLGMVADISYHDKGDGNPHAHVLLSTRTISQDGFGGKEREWNDKELLQSWRESWEKTANNALRIAGYEDIKIDCRTLEAQGIDRVPQIHIGPTASAMERRGSVTKRGDHNRLVREYNEVVEEIENLRMEIEATDNIQTLKVSSEMQSVRFEIKSPAPIAATSESWTIAELSETYPDVQAPVSAEARVVRFVPEEQEKLEEQRKAAEEQEKLEEQKKLEEQERTRREAKEKEAEKAAEKERQRQEAEEKAAEKERQRQEAEEKAAEKERQRQEAEEKAAEKERQRQEAEEAAEKERQRQEAEKEAEKERQRQEAEAAEKARENAIEIEAAKITAKQQHLREQFDAVQEKWTAMQKAEPGFGIFGESQKHKIWGAEFEQHENDRRRAWEALGGDMDAPDNGKAEVKRRLTPEYARSEAEKIVEGMERRERAQKEAREAQEQREAAEIKAEVRRRLRVKREEEFTLPLEADPYTFVTLSIRIDEGIRDLVCRITSVYKEIVRVKSKDMEFEINRDHIVDVLPAPEQTRAGERQSQQTRRRGSNDLGR